MAREHIVWNDGWGFTYEFTEQLLGKDNLPELEQVRLPHTVKELPFHYFDESEYQMDAAYRREFMPKEEWRGQCVLLNIGAAGHFAAVYLNGQKIAEHSCGYTAFTVDLQPYIVWEQSNVLVIEVDSHETLDQPPFGLVIDYMTYGGLYREVALDIKPQSHIVDVFPVVTAVSTKDGRKGDVSMESRVTLAGQTEEMTVRQLLRDDSGEVLLALDPGTVKLKLKGAMLWSPAQPALYKLETQLWQGDTMLDSRIDRIGLRQIEFKADGLYINGFRQQLRGLNRHQSWPYVGYAMPKSMQRLDADILKNELGVTAVRTSHYPQSHYFIERCDELGILVFTEIPGWQHIGGADWQNQAVKNTEDMIKQYRNHPSIFMWGVRINESVDNDDFYTRTNEVAHELDPSRPTSGVRCITQSSLLEDVYAYNDFSYYGHEKKGVLPKKKVTPDMKKGLLVSEYGGHMYPTKAFDPEEQRVEHLRRHAKVMNDYYGNHGCAGGFGWCMFDYNTHKDFGSGDRICYHGVLDMFRNPKLAAAVYASQQDETPYFEISSQMEIGEHPATLMKDVYALTNADCVRVYKNDMLVKEYTAQNSPFSNLPHPPILMDDFVGDLMEKLENMSHKQAEEVKAVLIAANKYGMNNLPPKAKAYAAKCLSVYHMTMEEAMRLYGKYMANWGGEAVVYRFEAIKDGKVFKSIEKAPMKTWKLECTVDHTALIEDTTYDVAAIRFQAVSQLGNLLDFCNEPVSLSVIGPVQIIGPSVVSLRGGMGGTYIKTTGETGTASLTLQVEGQPPVNIDFTVEV